MSTDQLIKLLGYLYQHDADYRAVRDLQRQHPHRFTDDHVIAYMVLRRMEAVTDLTSEVMRRTPQPFGVRVPADSEAARMVREGKYPRASMGAHVPTEVCTICGWSAWSSELGPCAHLLPPAHERIQVDPEDPESTVYVRTQKPRGPVGFPDMPAPEDEDELPDPPE